MSRWFVRPGIDLWASTSMLRWPLRWVDLAAGCLPRSEDLRREVVPLDDCDAEAAEPEGGRADRAVLYLHGGAFLTCGLNTHRPVAARIAQAADARVLSVAYRLLPAHPISAAIEDALAGYRSLLSHGYRGENIVVAGDSAGGYLAFMTALSCRAADLPMPGGIVALSPLTDLNPARKLAHRNVTRCAMFSERALHAFVRCIRTGRSRVRVDGSAGPLVSPVDEDLSGLPPVLIHAAADELLLVDAELMASRLRRAGVDCELHVWDGQIHAFAAASMAVPETVAAIGTIGRFVRRVAAGEPPVAA